MLKEVQKPESQSLAGATKASEEILSQFLAPLFFVSSVSDSELEQCIAHIVCLQRQLKWQVTAVLHVLKLLVNRMTTEMRFNEHAKRQSFLANLRTHEPVVEAMFLAFRECTYPQLALEWIAREGDWLQPDAMCNLALKLLKAFNNVKLQAEAWQRLLLVSRGASRFGILLMAAAQNLLLGPRLASDCKHVRS